MAKKKQKKEAKVEKVGIFLTVIGIILLFFSDVFGSFFLGAGLMHIFYPYIQKSLRKK